MEYHAFALVRWFVLATPAPVFTIGAAGVNYQADR